jgi:UTP--glucose-1-phosphate uridylyltransferase
MSFLAFEEKMQSAGLAPVAINTFRYQYELLTGGATGLIGESEIEPVQDLPKATKLGEEYEQAGKAALAKAVFVKLNGGLGTGMGLEKAKSLLEVKNGLTFLDIIAKQVLYLRQAYQTNLPMVLMNSFNTRADSLKALETYPQLQGDVPLDFMQHKVPKVLQSDFSPAEWAENPDLEWCPPGHGDFYTALVTSGMLEKLLEHGYEYAFVSNADNLGAVMDEAILGYFAQHDLPFMMEVTTRTEIDKKGGHLARRQNGRLVLRESAQCPDSDMEFFQDITRYSYFNTNNVWINLKQLSKVLEEHNGVIRLPLIRNSKTLDPRLPDSPKVYQLETAIGAAIEVFEGAAALDVPRTRFAPVKVCSDLVGLWSNAYVLTDDYRVVLDESRKGTPPLLLLDQKIYKLINDLQLRFPNGAPSLIDCIQLTVEGDVLFEDAITVRGTAKVSNPANAQKTLKRGTIVEGNIVI